MILQMFIRWTNGNPVSKALWTLPAEQNKLSDAFLSVDRIHWYNKGIDAEALQKLEDETKYRENMFAKDPKNESLICTVLLLLNLAKPEWMPIACEEKFLGDIMCSMYSRNGINALVAQTFIDPKIYPKNCIKFKESCYLVLWRPKHIVLRNYHPDMFKTFPSELLDDIFHATGSKLPPVFSVDLLHIVSWDIFSGNCSKTIASDQTKGLHIKKWS